MKIQYFILIAFFLTSSIKSEKGVDLQSITDGQTVTENNELKSFPNKDSILIEQKVLHDFSQIGKKDEFYICIKGKSILEGKMILKIISHEGKEILKEDFPSYLLLGYGFEGDPNSVKDREDYMKSRIRDFFDEKNFNYPAIKSDEVFIEDYSDKKIWNDIQSDRSAVGFSYLIGEEDGRKIAYSKKTKKVVMYFNCC